MAPVSEFSESAVSFDPSRKSTMKVTLLIVVASWATMSCSCTCEATSQGSDVSRAAAAQLQRLAGFRRSGIEETGGQVIAREKKAANEPRHTRSSAKKITADQPLEIPIDFGELFRIFSDSGSPPRDRRQIQLTPERMAKLNKYADKIMQDERVQSYMQERIKRDGYGGGYGGGGSGGSGAFISGLAGQVVGSVVGLSTTASKGSSSSSGHQSPQPVYGPPAHHSYGKESFGFLDFKKAILSTLIQAVKAIGGGVLALKGQLIKGGGFAVSTTGRLISSAGDAVTGLGKSLASSAIVQPPPAAHPGYGYAYEAPVLAHDAHYDGPPPSSDAYHSTFGAASDDDVIQPGLLIAKPTPSIEVHTEHLQTDHHHHTDYHGTEHEQVEELDPRNPGYNEKDVTSHLTSTDYHGDSLKYPETQSGEEPPSIPGNTLQLQDYNQANYELYPPLGNGPDDDAKTYQQPPKPDSPVIDYKNTGSYTQQYEHPPADLKDTYGPPSKYGVPSVDYHANQDYVHVKPILNSHRAPDIQIEISDHDITGFESGGYSQHKRLPPGLHLVAMPGPLKIPILGPHSPGHYKGSVFPPGHINSINGIGKYPKFGPNFEVQQSIAYELRKRRDHSRIHRI